MKPVEFKGVRGRDRLNPFLEEVIEAVDLSINDLPRLLPRKQDTSIYGGSVKKMLSLSGGIVYDATNEYGFVWNDIGVFVGSSWKAKTPSTDETITIPSTPEFEYGKPYETGINMPDYEAWARTHSSSLIPNWDFSNGGTDWTVVAGTWTSGTPSSRKLTSGSGTPSRGELLSSEAAITAGVTYVCSFMFWVDSASITTTTGDAYITVSIEGTTGGGANASELISITVPKERIFSAQQISALNVPVGETNPSAFSKTHVRVRIKTNVIDLCVTQCVAKAKSSSDTSVSYSNENSRLYGFFCTGNSSNSVTAWFSTPVDLSQYEIATFLHATFASVTQPAKMVIIDGSGIETEIEGFYEGGNVWYYFGSAPRSQVFAIRFETERVGQVTFSIKSKRTTYGGKLGIWCSGSISTGEAVYVAKAVFTLSSGLKIESKQTEPFRVSIGNYGSAYVLLSHAGGTNVTVRLYRATGGKYMLVDEKSVTGGQVWFVDNGIVTPDVLIPSDGVLPNGPAIVWNGRAVVGVGTKCWFSALGQPLLFQENYTSEEAGWVSDIGTVIIGFSVKDGRLMVYTKSGIYALVGSSSMDMTFLRVNSMVAVSHKAIASDDVFAFRDGLIAGSDIVFKADFNSSVAVAIADQRVAICYGQELWLSSELGWVKYSLSVDCVDVIYHDGYWYAGGNSGILKIEGSDNRVAQAYLKTGKFVQMPMMRLKWMYVFGSGSVDVITENGTKTEQITKTRVEIPLPAGSLSRWIQFQFKLGASDMIDLVTVLYHEVDASGDTRLRAK